MRLLALATLILAGAAPATGSAAPGDSREAAQAMRIAADRIEADYIDAAQAPRLAARLRREADMLGRRPRQGEALAGEVTDLLRAVTSDPHFGFRYSPEAMPADIFAAKPPADRHAAERRTARMNNFGILKAERMPGNIGLIDIDQFTDSSLMRRPLAAAMELLRHCDAMIIDLRYNGGGDAAGAALVASYFLPEDPRRVLVRFESRRPEKAVELRTEGSLESPRFLDRPVYVLTGSGTFSAAEFFTGVLQRAGKAIVVGVGTRGGAHPVERIRLTAHYGMMLPTMRHAMRSGSNPAQRGLVPDQPAEPGQALIVASRAAAAALLAERPQDPLAEKWSELLGKAPTPGDTPKPSRN